MNAITRTSAATEAAGARGRQAAERINMLGEMAGGIAHDFRNILAVIGSALNLAERQIGVATPAAPYVEAARKGIERGLALTNRLLALAKPHGAEIHTQRLARIVRELAPFLGYAAGSRVRIVLDLDETLPACAIDAAQFNAALLNLIVNARDAMPDGGEIRIGTELTGAPDGGEANAGRWLCVLVSDSGQGMSDDTLRHIFEPWFTTKGDGTGLGLPQVHAFVRSAGGRIEVASVPGGGTTFRLLFPVAGEGPPSPWNPQIDRWMDEGGSARGRSATPQ